MSKWTSVIFLLSIEIVDNRQQDRAVCASLHLTLADNSAQINEIKKTNNISIVCSDLYETHWACMIFACFIVTLSL